MQRGKRGLEKNGNGFLFIEKTWGGKNGL